MKSRLILETIFTLCTLSFATAAFAQCQHPYCNGPNAPVAQAPAPTGPTVYNRQYCYGNNCYPGAYVSGAIDKEGHTNIAPTTENSDLSAADQQKQELAQVGVARYTASNYKPGKILHEVLFKFAPAVSAQQKDEAKKRFLALGQLAQRNGRPYIVSVSDEAANELSGEGANQGFEQRIVVTFKSQGDRNYYVGQPVVTDSNYYDAAHQAFKDFVGPLLERNETGDVTGVIVMDFKL